MAKTPSKAERAALRQAEQQSMRKITIIWSSVLSCLVFVVAGLAIRSPLSGQTTMEAGKFRVTVDRHGPALFDIKNSKDVTINNPLTVGIERLVTATDTEGLRINGAKAWR